MTPSYQFFHGALLHEIIVQMKADVTIALYDFHGRPDAYIFDGEVGLLLKYSSRRLSPWTFTFAKEHVDEFASLRAATSSCFLGLVCDEDGFLCLRDSRFDAILGKSEKGTGTLRVARRPRGMYEITSSGNELDSKVAMGVDEIVGEIKSKRGLIDSVALQR